MKAAGPGGVIKFMSGRNELSQVHSGNTRLKDLPYGLYPPQAGDVFKGLSRLQ